MQSIYELSNDALLDALCNAAATVASPTGVALSHRIRDDETCGAFRAALQSRLDRAEMPFHQGEEVCPKNTKFPVLSRLKREGDFASHRVIEPGEKLTVRTICYEEREWWIAFNHLEHRFNANGFERVPK